MDAYDTRYRRELRDIGIATALAQHDPKKLDQMFPPTPKPSSVEGKWW